MTGARLDSANVAFDSFNKIRIIQSERSREISDCRTREYFALIVHQPRIGRRRLYQIGERIVSCRLPTFLIKDQHCTGDILRACQFIGDRDVAAPLVDKAAAVTVDQYSFVDEGIESRIGPEAVVDERFA